MSPLKKLIGECQHCGGHFEFPAQLIGTRGDCPVCGKQTDFLLAVPQMESAVSRKLVVWTVIGILVLLICLAGALVVLRLTREMVGRSGSPSPAPASQNVNR